jgi:hypothetical protein
MFLGEMEESVPDIDLGRCYSFNLTENPPAKKPLNRVPHVRDSLIVANVGLFSKTQPTSPPKPKTRKTHPKH